jgi:RecA/RadA recombinase
MVKSRFTTSNLEALRQSLIKDNHLRSLDSDEAIPAISSGSQPLDWITDCGGLPRGRIVQFKGPESSGKCVALNTFVPVFDQGIITLQDITRQTSWKTDELDQVIPDQVAELAIRVPGSNADPVHVTNVYFAGNLPTCKIITEDGHPLIGSREHRPLVLTPRGVVAYTPLRDIRVGVVLVKSIGQAVSGPYDRIWDYNLPTDYREITLRESSTAALFGALCGVEFRDNQYYLLVNDPYQIRLVRQWARDVTGDSEVDPFDETVADFGRFAGMARLREGKWSEMARRSIEEVPGIMRQSSLTAQAHWCAGLTLVRGSWILHDLEFEIQSETVARTLQLLMENIGVRCTLYPSLNTFAYPMTKVALRDRIAQQQAEDLIWRGYHVSPDWRGCTVRESTETHEYVHETLVRAREVFNEEGKSAIASGVDVDDLDKDNLLRVAEWMHPLARRKRSADRVYESLLLLGTPYTHLDRVIYSKALTDLEPLADLRVPICSHYVTNSLISHNSTLALHYAKRDLQSNPQSLVVFQDFEHSTTPKYARKIIQNNYDRFFLLPSDIFEDTDKLLMKFFRDFGVIPSLWVIDSVPAMVPKLMFGKIADDDDENDGEKKKGTGIALQARLFSEALARWVKLAGSYSMTFLMLNQIRSKIELNPYAPQTGSGRATPGVFDSQKESTPGGFALRFYNSMTFDIRPKVSIKKEIYNPYLAEKEDVPVANSVKITISKNKCGSPFRSCMIYIQYGEGVDDTRSIFDISLARGLIKNPSRGVFATDLGDGRTFSIHGRENFIAGLRGTEPLGLEAVNRLKELLQWGRVEEFHDQILGMKTEDVESGEVETLEKAADSGQVDPGILDYIRSRPTFVEKADALDMLSRNKSTIYWKNPQTGKEFSARSLGKLIDKMDAESENVFITIIQTKIAELESRVFGTDSQSKNNSLELAGPGAVPLGEGALGVTEWALGVTEGGLVVTEGGLVVTEGALGVEDQWVDGSPGPEWVSGGEGVEVTESGDLGFTEGS